MRVFLTGGSGFVGRFILRELLARDHSVRCLVRPGAEARLRAAGDARVEVVTGDVTDASSLQGRLDGCDAVIHLVGILREDPARGLTYWSVHLRGTRHVADAARAAGVERFVLMSANGARPDAPTGYQTSKWEAEEYVKRAGFRRWTIFRPSLVFGDPRPDADEFATRLARTLIRPFPVLPILGDGLYRLQPISVEELASAFAQAVTAEQAAGKTYCAAGREALTFLEIVDTITRGLGDQPKPKIRQPLWLVRPVIRSIGNLGLLPITPDQLEMLVEGNTCDPAAFYRDFALSPRPFTPENLAYLRG